MQREYLPIAEVAGAGDSDDLCVARVPLFRELDRAAQLEVAGVAHPTRFAKNQQLYSPGEHVSQMMVVHAGQIKLSRISVDGHEQIVRVLGPGEFVGEAALLSGERPDHFATALDAGSVCIFRHGDLERLAQVHPSIVLRMLEGVSRRLSQTEGRLAAAISADVSSRVAAYLLSLPMLRGRATPTVRLPLAKKDIASLLDTTPESLSRQLRRLQDSGVINQETGRTIALTDSDALVALAGDV